MLEFDAETSKILDRAYVGRDFRERRRASFEALDPQPGERIADIGCGNGLLTQDLAVCVGSEGHVFGIDPSDEMLALAKERLVGFDNAEVRTGKADALGLEEDELDGAVSLQVFEYLDDPAASLGEAHRALRKGGRLVIGDMHFDTLAWASDDPERMNAMCRSWNAHVADPALPARLPSLMRDAGFDVTGVTPLTFVDMQLRPDGLAKMMIILMQNYAVSNGHVRADEARAWADEQETLAREGRFFMTLTHFVISARAV